jgi:hypothetical protein
MTTRRVNGDAQPLLTCAIQFSRLFLKSRSSINLLTIEGDSMIRRRISKNHSFIRMVFLLVGWEEKTILRGGGLR